MASFKAQGIDTGATGIRNWCDIRPAERSQQEAMRLEHQRAAAAAAGAAVSCFVM